MAQRDLESDLQEVVVKTLETLKSFEERALKDMKNKSKVKLLKKGNATINEFFMAFKAQGS
jgi:hypothetical protein